MTQVICANAGFKPGDLSFSELGEDGRITPGVLAQGYLFARPAPVIEVLARAADRLEAPS